MSDRENIVRALTDKGYGATHEYRYEDGERVTITRDSTIGITLGLVVAILLGAATLTATHFAGILSLPTAGCALATIAAAYLVMRPSLRVVLQLPAGHATMTASLRSGDSCSDAESAVALVATAMGRTCERWHVTSWFGFL